MDTAFAKRFAHEWINAWNTHDLDAILSHYSEEIEFSSPFIIALHINETGKITGKAHLQAYFKKGLDNYPALHFELQNILTGVNTLILYYTSVQGRQAAEVFEFNRYGKAIKVCCNYNFA